MGFPSLRFRNKIRCDYYGANHVRCDYYGATMRADMCSETFYIQHISGKSISENLNFRWDYMA